MRKSHLLILAITIFCGLTPPAAARAAAGAEIKIMGFNATLENYVVQTEGGVLTFKGKGSLDLSSVLGSSAVISSDDMTVDSNGNATFKNIVTPEFKIGAFSAQAAPGDLVIKSDAGAGQTFNLNVTIKVNLGDQTLQVAAALPITKDGIADAIIDLKPPAGQDNFFSKQFNDISLALKSGKLEFKNKAFSSFSFTGSLNILGSDLQLKQVTVTQSGVSGHADGSLNLASISLAFTEGVDFTYDKASGFKATVGKAGIDISKVIPGASVININKMSFADGKFSADSTMQQTLSVGGASINLTRIVINSDKKTGKPYIKASIEGSVSLPTPKVDIKFTGLEIDSDGNLKSDITLPQPQTLTMFGAGLTVNAVSLQKQAGAISIALAGELALGSDKLKFSGFGVQDGKVAGKFDVTKAKPFSFSWFPYMKVSQLEISKGELLLGGSVETPDPVKYSFTFQDVKFDMNGDFKKAAATGAQNAWDKVTDASLISIVNTNTTPLTVSGFSFYINAVTVPNPLAAIKNKSFPDTLLKLYMKAEVPLSGKKITFNIDGLEITKAGVKDLTLDIAPPSGQTSFFAQDFGGFANVSVKKVSLVVKDRQFKSLAFSGSLSLTTPKVTADITSIIITADKKVTGEATLDKAPLTLSLCGLGLSVTGVKFAIDGSDNISVNLAGSIKLGNDNLAVSSLLIDKTGISAKFAVTKDKPFSFSWFPYMKVTQLEISKNELLFGGRVESPDPVKYTFAFQDVKFDINGDIKKAAVTGAQNAWDKVSGQTLISIVNTNTSPFTVAGFSFYVDAITVPNPFAAIKSNKLPDTLLSLYMRAEIPLGDNKLNVNVQGLEITKSGLKDLTLNITPDQGKKSLYSVTFSNWAEFRVDGAKLIVKGGKFDSFSFTGAVTFDGSGFNITSLAIKDGALSGSLKPVGDASFKVGGIKLAFGGDISFKVAGGSQKSSSGGGGPPANVTTPFSVSFKKVTLDLTEALGNSSAKVTFDEISYNDGGLKAEIKSATTFDFSILKLSVSNFLLESKKPDQGKSRTFDVSLDGNLKFMSDKISLDFKRFKISSSGDISAVITPASPQAFDLYIMSFTVKQFTIGKKSGQSFELALSGSFTIAKGTPISFDSLKYSNGKISFLITRSDNDAIKLPVCDFVKLTKFEIKDNVLTLSGFMDVPVLNFRLVAQDITVSSDGGVTGGVFKLGSAASINLGALSLTISDASFDLKTKYLKYSGKISLPSDIFSGSFDFKDMGLQLANKDNITQDTSKSKITAPATAEDKKHGFPIKITGTSFGFKDGKFVFGLSGTLTYMGKFTLNFENFTIAASPSNVKDVSFGIGKVTGSIKVSAFSLEITDFKINDTDADPSVLISGGLSLPQFGSVKVVGLQIYKSGKIKLDGLEIKMDKGAYKVGAKISFKDDAFNGAGTITFGDKTLNVSVMFSKTEFKFEVSVSGLNIVLFPGITLDGVGGGIHCKYDPLWMEFKLSADIGLGSGKFLKGRVTLVFNTSGVVSITGELFIFDTLKLGEANITADIPNKTVTGYAKVNASLASIVSLNFQVNIYFSPSDWYVKGSGGASIASVSLGSVTLDVSSKGFYLKGSYGYSASIFSATLSFEFKVVSANDISVRLTGSGSVDLVILSVSVSIDFRASYSNSEFNGSVGVSGCIHVALWLPVSDTCHSWVGCPCCCCFWPGWNSQCWQLPYPCNFRMQDFGGDVCKSATLHLRINKNGISAWL